MTRFATDMSLRRVLAGLLLVVSVCVPSAASEPYTVDELLHLADGRNPRLAAARAAIAEAQGRSRQAGLYPNPFLDVMHDDVPTDSGDVSDGKTTVSLGQPIIVGRRRGHAVRATQAAVEAATWEYEATRHTVFQELHAVWFEIAYLSEAMQIESNLVSQAEQIARIATRDSDAARATVMAETLLASILGLSTQQAIARDRLEYLLGGERLEAARLRGTLESALDPTEVARLQSQIIEEHPRHHAAEAATRAAQWEMRAVRSRVTPDITVSVLGGYAGRDEEGFAGAGVMVPIPLLNRLQGARAEARALASRREAEQEDVTNELRAELRILLQMLNELDTLVENYGRSIVPMAHRAHEATVTDYQAGTVTVTDALDTLTALGAAQRSELRYRLELSQTLSRYRHFVRYGPTSSVTLPIASDSTSASP